jgi:hypothetical protein
MLVDFKKCAVCAAMTVAGGADFCSACISSWLKGVMGTVQNYNISPKPPNFPTLFRFLPFFWQIVWQKEVFFVFLWRKTKTNKKEHDEENCIHAVGLCHDGAYGCSAKHH